MSLWCSESTMWTEAFLESWFPDIERLAIGSASRLRGLYSGQPHGWIKSSDQTIGDRIAISIDPARSLPPPRAESPLPAGYNWGMEPNPYESPREEGYEP